LVASIMIWLLLLAAAFQIYRHNKKVVVKAWSGC
jgi:hypothetical protein